MKKRNYKSNLTIALKAIPKKEKLADIHRFAKRPGLRPFFRDPRDMIELRQVIGGRA